MDSVNTSLKISLRRKWCGLHKVQVADHAQPYTLNFDLFSESPNKFLDEKH